MNRVPVLASGIKTFNTQLAAALADDGKAVVPKGGAFGLKAAHGFGMKRTSLRIDAKGGWVRTTIAPLNDKHEARFGVMDVVVFMSLVALTLALARFFIAH